MCRGAAGGRENDGRGIGSVAYKLFWEEFGLWCWPNDGHHMVLRTSGDGHCHGG